MAMPPARLPFTPSPSVAVFRGGFARGAHPEKWRPEARAGFLSPLPGVWPVTLEPEGAGEGSGSRLDGPTCRPVLDCPDQTAVPCWRGGWAAFDVL